MYSCNPKASYRAGAPGTASQGSRRAQPPTDAPRAGTAHRLGRRPVAKSGEATPPLLDALGSRLRGNDGEKTRTNRLHDNSPMTDDQLLRYSRHILLDEVGVEGQERFLASHALV